MAVCSNEFKDALKDDLFGGLLCIMNQPPVCVPVSTSGIPMRICALCMSLIFAESYLAAINQISKACQIFILQFCKMFLEIFISSSGNFVRVTM